MSTPSERETALRRALLSAAESIEPGSDGFERIQARLRRPRPLLVAWVEAAWTGLRLRVPELWAAAGLRVPAWLQTVARQLAEAFRQALKRFAPTSGPGQSGPMRWLRPLTAISVAVFVIAVGTYVGLGSPAFISPTGSSTAPNGGQTGKPGAGGPHAHSSVLGSASASHSYGQPGSSSSSSCPPTTKPRRNFTSPPPTPSTSPSTTAPGGGPSSPSSSPSPSASASSTPDPGNSSAGTAAGDTTGGNAADGQSALGDSAGRAAPQPSSAAAKILRTTAQLRLTAYASSSPPPCPSQKPKRKKRHASSPQPNAGASLSSPRLTADGQDAVPAKLDRISSL